MSEVLLIAIFAGGDQGHDVDGVGSTVGVTYFRRAMYPSLRIAAASSSPSRTGANFLPDGVAIRRLACRLLDAAVTARHGPPRSATAKVGFSGS